MEAEVCKTLDDGAGWECQICHDTSPYVDTCWQLKLLYCFFILIRCFNVQLLSCIYSCLHPPEGGIVDHTGWTLGDSNCHRLMTSWQKQSNLAPTLHQVVL